MSKIVDWIKSVFLNKYLASMIRHVMTFVSGWLLTLGIAPELVEQFSASATEIVIAVVLYLVAQIWSLKNKVAQD